MVETLLVETSSQLIQRNIRFGADLRVLFSGGFKPKMQLIVDGSINGFCGCVQCTGVCLHGCMGVRVSVYMGALMYGCVLSFKHSLVLRSSRQAGARSEIDFDFQILHLLRAS